MPRLLMTTSSLKRKSSKPDQVSSAALPDGMRVKAPTKNLAGQKFGRLTCIEVTGKSPANSLLWRCICDCGTEATRSSANLRSKGVSSCGCYLQEINRERFAKSSPWNRGKSYATKKSGAVYATKKSWSDAVRREKGSACEVCGWGKASCDVHHRIPRSEGGLNTIENGVVLCPNCHRVQHEVGGVC